MLLGAPSAIRNDRDTLFWTARWVDSGSRLLVSVEDTDAARNLSESVADYTNSDEQWDVEKLTSVLSLDQVSLVVGKTPPRAESGEDQWVWGGETNGHFSIRSAYKLIYTQANSIAHDRWKLCWKWKERTISVAWEPGPAEWITLNSDGSFGARAGRATTGGLARDADGRCIFAYTMNLGNCSITRAEMRGAIEGLRRTWVVSTGRSSCNLTHRRRFISFLMKMILDISTLWKRPASKSYAVVTGR
ncbi:hypothetical protein LINPERHAP2_LOCUS16812 [Linum perenne]